MEPLRFLTYAKTQCGFSHAGRKVRDSRNFIEAILYLMRFGGCWRHLPQCYGKFKTIHSLFSDYAERGVWKAIFGAVVRPGKDDDCKRFVDSTFAKAATFSMTGKVADKERLIGKTKGGQNTKITWACDNLKRVHFFRIDPGNKNDVPILKSMLSLCWNIYLVADKGYDCDEIRNTLDRQGCLHCIRPKENRKEARPFDPEIYKERRLVENSFCEAKRFFRFQVRRERTSRNFNAFVTLCAAMTWFQ